jgi:SAM-dependent methyltransferase
MNQNPIFQRLATLAEATRVRLLLVLEREELTVSELCGVVQLPQSTVSRHLRVLGDEGWLGWRSEGPSRYYRVVRDLAPEDAALWGVMRESVVGTAEARADAARARDVLDRRRTRSQAYFASAAGRWDAVRAELFGGSPELPALLALLDREWVVGDFGCGTGGVTERVWRYVARVVAVDESPDMLAAARSRLASAGGGGKVEFRAGRVEALPLGGGSVDVALLVLVLHYVTGPERALAECFRVLRPGGRVLVVEMAEHDRSEYRERMGHVWPGFDRRRMEGWLVAAGFERVASHPLPVDPAAKGPPLFAAVGTKANGEQEGKE